MQENRETWSHFYGTRQTRDALVKFHKLWSGILCWKISPVGGFQFIFQHSILFYGMNR